MKIAMIGCKGIPTRYGGVERHVEEVSICLAQKKDYQVYVYARPYYTFKNTKKYKGVNIINLYSLATKHLDAITHSFLASLHAIFILKTDVFHYHAIGPAWCIWVPKILAPSKKIIFTFHCRDYFHQKWGRLARFSLKFGEVMGCFLADDIITVSPELKEYVRDVYHREATFIPHGSTKEKILTPKIIKKWNLKKNNYILVVSRLIRHKGIHYLIKAYQNIKPDKKLVIVGPSFYTADYERELKEMTAGDKNIIFLGAQKGKALKELYSNAYTFVSPSEIEGFPLVVIEAAAFGRSLLLSNIRPHTDMFAKLPFFFKNKNIKDLEKKLRFVLDEPALISERAREIKNYSQEHYNWHSIVDKTVLKYT